jgi:hypothetical protein
MIWRQNYFSERSKRSVRADLITTFVMRLTAPLIDIHRFAGTSFPSQGWEAMTRASGALVCIAAVYSFDALVFDGRYAAGIIDMLSDLYVHW